MRGIRIFLAAAFFVAAGMSTTTAHAEDNQGALAWGFNFGRDLGRPDVAENGSDATPGPIAGGAELVQVDGGFRHSIALTADGRVLSVGDNGYYHQALGDPSIDGRATFGPVLGLPPIKRIVAGMDSNAAIDLNGGLWLWGQRVGDGAGNASPGGTVPVRVEGLPPIVDISIGAAHWIALDNVGQAWVWGLDDQDQLGISPRRTLVNPTPVDGYTNIKAVAASSYTTYVLKSDGSVDAWGYNQEGELGNSVPGQSAAAVRIHIPEPVTSITGGGYHACAIGKSTAAWCWGGNGYGQAGASSTPYAPRRIVGPAGGYLLGVASLAAGGWHSLALLYDGTVWGWGQAQPAGDPLYNWSSAHQVPALSHVAAINAGWSTSFAIVGPRDTVPPVGSITQPSVISIPARDQLHGVATDDNSGVASVNLFLKKGPTFNDVSPVAARLNCNGNRRSCTWIADFPKSIGKYHISGFVLDGQGNRFDLAEVETLVVATRL